MMVSIGIQNLGAGFTYGVKGRAQPGNVFPAETTVTASDSTNAAKLAGLGYVAYPTTNWTTGQQITVGGYAFNWNGTAWVAGTHALRTVEGQSEAPATKSSASTKKSTTKSE